MAAFAKFTDGVEVSEKQFDTLAKYAKNGTLDVFASDQHGSYKKLLGQFFKAAGIEREVTDNDVAEVCCRFAAQLGKASGTAKPSAALFNHLAFNSPGFREKLTEDIMLIGRLEDTVAEEVDGGKGMLARLAVQPEDIAGKVDGFKTLVKLNPDHPESWERNKEWLADVFERTQKLGMLLFNETLLLQLPGESKMDMARKLPEAVVKMAEDFGTLGHFYKTQVPVLWMSDSGPVERISSPDVIRGAAKKMSEIVPRPMLLLSAAVDFEQYAAQYSYVADMVAGPMCGRAYFKEAFAMNLCPGKGEAANWDVLEQNFAKLALPRIELIKKLTTAISPPWWHKFESISDEAKAKVDVDAKPRIESVKGDYGY